MRRAKDASPSAVRGAGGVPVRGAEPGVRRRRPRTRVGAVPASICPWNRAAPAGPDALEGAGLRAAARTAPAACSPGRGQCTGPASGR